MVIVGLWHSQLDQDAAHVLFNGALGDPELPGDARIGPALGHEREYLTLPWGQSVKRIVAVPGGDEFLHEAGVDDNAAARYPSQSVDELLYVGDAALEEVADALAAGEELHRVLDLNVRRQHEDGGLRELCANNARRRKALCRVVWRHPDIDDYQVGFALAHQLDKVGGIACLADDMEAGLLEQARDPLTEEDVIVGQDYTRLRHVTMIPPLACGGR